MHLPTELTGSIPRPPERTSRDELRDPVDEVRGCSPKGACEAQLAGEARGGS